MCVLDNNRDHSEFFSVNFLGCLHGLNCSCPFSVFRRPWQAQQISREDMLFRMTLFVTMFSAETKGIEEADMAVRGQWHTLAV